MNGMEPSPVGGGMFDGVDEVFGQGVYVVEESIRVISITEVSYQRRQLSLLL